MRLTRRHVVLLSVLSLLAVAASGIAIWWFVLRANDDVDAARRSTEDYFSRAVANDLDGAYQLLAGQTQQQISAEEWRARNEEALQATGPLSEARVLSIDLVTPGEAYATVELTFDQHEPLVIVVPLVKEEDQWKLQLSVGDDAAEGWQRVGPKADGTIEEGGEP